MRTKPYLGTKPWFGPRRFGWGWEPCAWQGWVLAAFFVLALVVARGSAVATFAIVVALLVVAALTGTSPGGPRTLRELKIRRGEIPLVPGGGDDAPDIADVTDNFDQRDLQ